MSKSFSGTDSHSLCRCCAAANCGKRKGKRKGGSVQPSRAAKIRIWGAQAKLPPYRKP